MTLIFYPSWYHKWSGIILPVRALKDFPSSWSIMDKYMRPVENVSDSLLYRT